MKNKLLIWILVFVLAAVTIYAAPPNPEFYWGYVYIEGNLAPNGTNLTCRTEAGELLINETLPYNDTGSYFAQIDFDKPQTPKDEGADFNESIIWYIDGIAAIDPTNDTAESGKNNNNFTIIGIRNPNVNVSTNYSSQYSVGDLFNLTVTLNNIGNGSSNSDVVFENATKSLFVQNNSINSTNFNQTLDSCGDFNNSLDVYIKNYANTSVDNYSEDIVYSVIGPDLDVDLSVSDTTPRAGDSVTIEANITNVGEENITGYNFSLHAGSTELISTEYNNTLEPNATRNITYFWTAQTGVSQIRANVSTATNQCLLTNDEEIVNITVSSGGSGGGGGGGRRTVVPPSERTEPMTFEILNFPKTLEDLIYKDIIKFIVDDEWYTIIIEDVSEGKAATTMTWEGKYYVFNENEEKVFEIKDYELYIKLEQANANKATFRLDLIKKPIFNVHANISDQFKPGSNVTFTVDVESDIDVNVDETLFKLNKEVWNNSIMITGAGIVEENIGPLEEGDYYLYIKSKAGKQVKEIEKEFAVGREQLPGPIIEEILGLYDFLLLMLIIIFSVALILSIKILTEKYEEEEEIEEEEGEVRTRKESQGGFKKIKDSISAIFSLAKKEKEEQEEKEGEEMQEGKEEKHMDFVGRKANVYLPYSNLLQLKEWLGEYHMSQHITHKMKKMPEIVQKIGPEVYENPKEVTRDDVVRLAKLFNEKHDYISYNDLVIGGSIVTKELKKTLGVVEKKKKAIKGKLIVKYHTLSEIDDAQEILDSLRKGSVVIVNAAPIYKSSKENLKRAVDKIKNTCDALGGDIALTFERHIIITPRRNVQIFRTHAE